MKEKPFIFVPHFKSLTFRSQLLDMYSFHSLPTCTDRTCAHVSILSLSQWFSTFLTRRPGADLLSSYLYWVLSVAENVLYFLFSFLFIFVFS